MLRAQSPPCRSARRPCLRRHRRRRRAPFQARRDRTVRGAGNRVRSISGIPARVSREPAQVRMAGRARLDVSVAHPVEHLVAEIKMQQLMVVAHGLDQPRPIGIAIDAEQHLCASHAGCPGFQPAPFRRRQGCRAETRPAVARSCSSRAAACGEDFLGHLAGPAISSSSSSSGGMLSSRSIMVENLAKAFQCRGIELPDIPSHHRVVVGVDDMGAHVAVAGHVKLHHAAAGIPLRKVIGS